MGQAVMVFLAYARETTRDFPWVSLTTVFLRKNVPRSSFYLVTNLDKFIVAAIGVVKYIIIYNTWEGTKTYADHPRDGLMNKH